MNQVIVITAFDDPTVIQDDNCVTVSNCGQSVCDNKYGTPLHQIVHTFLYDTLGTGINT